MLTGAQLRAARALVRISAAQLAQKAILGIATVRRAEAFDGPIQATSANCDAMHRVLEPAGVEFIDEDGGGPGVRLRRPQRVKGHK